MNVTCAIAPQLTVATFLANGGYDHHLRRLRSAYRVQMEQMQDVITHSFPPETCISRPEGGHVLWLELSPDFDAMALYEKALQEKISISPGILRELSFLPLEVIATVCASIAGCRGLLRWKRH